MTAYVDLSHLQANAPESRKRGLEKDREKRARMFMQFANRVRHASDSGRITATTSETGHFLLGEIAHRKGYLAAYPPANDKVRGLRRGNGFFMSLPGDIRDRDRISIKRTGLGGPLHQPVRLVSFGAATVAIIGIHAQTRRADPFSRSRRRLNEQLAAYIDQLDAAGIPVIVAGDANDAHWDRNFPGLEVAAHHGVDWILVSPSIKVRGSRTHRLPKVSDHHFISADLAIPVGDTTATKRLPKP